MNLEILQSVFLVIAVSVFLYLVHLLYRGTPRWRPLALGVTGWILFTTTLAATGVLSDFQSAPPRIPMLVGFQTVALVYLVFFSSWKRELLHIPQRYLIRLQSFRIYVEIVLAGLASLRLLPIEMTYHGRNFDLVTGILALMLARRVFRSGEVSCKKQILFFNVAGLFFLTTVMVIGILSAPYPHRILALEPSNGIIALFPFHLLPFFLVPTAYFLHFVSIRRALAMASEVDTLERPGVGMPPLEALVSRWILMPRIWKKFSAADGIKWFDDESDRIADFLKRSEATRKYRMPALVDPIPGLEDSSRNWSIAETLEHLAIVTKGMSGIAMKLARGEAVDFKVDTALVKPKGQALSDRPDADGFLREMRSLSASLREAMKSPSKEVKHAHPWFGPMTAEQWVLLLGIHQGIHRRQIQQIVSAGS